MAENDVEKIEDMVGEADADPWAVAFAALDKENENAVEAAADSGEHDGGNLPDADKADDGEGPASPEAGDGVGDETPAGGPGDTAGIDSPQDEGLDWDGIDLSEEELTKYREDFATEIRNRAIDDVARAYVSKGARNQNGRLGATINDPDICKRDRDGVPRFYNPETGREFSGDNPRRQAQEWVDDYNKELAEAFNKTCADYEKHLMEQEGGRLAIIEFAPKYKALDPVRRSMFESIIEDYEVTDKDGNVVAYSCDLDKALSAVNRQVKVIQERFSKQQQKEPVPPSGPALDTPSTGSGKPGNAKPQFKSIEEAMEWEQDQILAKMKGAR